MADKLRAVLRLLRVYGRLDLLWMLRDTKYCLLQMGADAVSTAASVAGMLLLASRYQGFGGMDFYSLLFMMGYATLVNGVFLVFFGNNNANQISRTIGRGQLDHCMIQPVPLWVQLMTQGFAPFSGGMTLLTGAGIAAYALGRMEFPVTTGWLAGVLLCLLCSTVVLVSGVYLVSCLAFYAPSAAEEVASVGLFFFTSSWTYPLGGLAPLWQGLFCTVLPVGAAAWLPSAWLTDSLPGGFGRLAPFLIPAVAAGLFFLTRTIFKRGLNHYEKDGSPRYVGFGHR